jgi:hypothetical protein
MINTRLTRSAASDHGIAGLRNVRLSPQKTWSGIAGQKNIKVWAFH